MPARLGVRSRSLCACRAAAAVAALLSAASPAAPQTTTAALAGRIFDSSGTPLPGVVIQIESRSHAGSRRSTATLADGSYRFPSLPPGMDYVAIVDYPGFARLEAGPITLSAGRITALDLTLRSAEESTETIKVEARGSVVDVDSTRTSASYNAEFLEGLPIIGHDYQDVLTLAPGVTDTDGDGNPNVHGARDTGLQYRLDGGNITDPVSGTYGQNLNMDIIEEVEVITAGASAEYGRADGGFANIITKSGGNDFDGKFSIYWRGRFLDGDGANNNDITRYHRTFDDYHDIRPTLTLGGSIVKDRLWYFGSLELVDTQVPVNQLGADVFITARAHYGFAKLTWQAAADHKLTLQLVSDPRSVRGLGLGLGVSPESDFVFGSGGATPQLKWTAVMSPRLLLESTLTGFRTGVSVRPVSRYFRPGAAETIQNADTRGTLQAIYPCRFINCDPLRGEHSIYQIDLVTGRVNGPYFARSADARVRNALRADLSYTVEDALGQHSLKTGIESADERFSDAPVYNPILLDQTMRPRGSTDPTAPVLSPDVLIGTQTLLTFRPLITPQRAAGLNTSVYAMDAWKPWPNLALNVGLRLDREDIDSSGYGIFDPRAERRRAIALWDAVCLEAQVQQLGTQVCQNRVPGNPPHNIPDGDMRSFRDGNGDGVNDVDPRVAALDLDHDGVIHMSGQEGSAQFRDFTRFVDRETTNFEIGNTNLAPRFSFSWDPAADGRTKIFGTWGRYYDRLFLGAVTGEIGPDQVTFTFFPNSVTGSFLPGMVSRMSSAVSITQVERDLRTPFTDELTFGVERELATDWAASVTYIRRDGRDLLQDVDINHLTCPQYRDVLGIDPYTVCGDAGMLEVDRFGDVGVAPGGTDPMGPHFNGNRGFGAPNGAPDLYIVNNGFNQIFRIGNLNSSSYEALELKITRRLHRNWQMQASYSWSQAVGQAESFLSTAGDDPETKDIQPGFLDYDQRHVVKFQAVTLLPHDIRLGSIVQWASGTPYSVTALVSDSDQVGNASFRRFYPTGRRNDQRNDGQWEIDGRLEKQFAIGKITASGFLLAENLTNADDLVILENNIAVENGGGVNGFRRFGRRWEIGMVINF